MHVLGALALGVALAVSAQPGSAALPRERALSIAPPSPVSGTDLGGWVAQGRRDPTTVIRGRRTLLRLELNTTLVSPPVWIPARAQALSLGVRSPGGGTLLVVRAIPERGGAPVELGVLEPRTALARQTVGIAAVAGGPVRLVIDPVTAYGRAVEISGVGPFLESMPGWRVSRGLPERRRPTSPTVRVSDAPLVATRVIRGARGGRVSVRVRGAGVLELRAGRRRIRARVGAEWRRVELTVPRGVRRTRVSLRATPGSGTLEIVPPERILSR